MNKQEAIEKIKSKKSLENCLSNYGLGYNEALDEAIYIINQIDVQEKPVVPNYVADMIIKRKKQGDSLVATLVNLGAFGDAQRWIRKGDNGDTFAKAWLYGYEVKKEKLYRAKNRHTGEYLCYCFKFYHDKNSSSENQRFTAEEKRWKELGYWGNDLYVFEEAEGEDE